MFPEKKKFLLVNVAKMTSKNIPWQVKCDPINRRIWSKIYKKDKNVLIFVCGETGSCKSGSALRKCIELDRDKHNKCRFYFSADPFDPGNRVVTSAQAFVKLISSGLPKGSCIIWDEIGVDADNREYFTLKNRLVKKVFQTFRYLNLIVFMTVPDFHSVDIGVRKLIHAYIEMGGKIGDGEQAISKWQWTSTNPKSGDVYFKYPQYVDSEGMKKKIKSYEIPRPPKNVEKIYKELKDNVNKNWYENYNKQLAFMQHFLKEGAAQKNVGELEKEVMANQEDYFDTDNFAFLDFEIESKLGISAAKATKVANRLNKKLKANRLKLEPFLEKHRPKAKKTQIIGQKGFRNLRKR